MKKGKVAVILSFPLIIAACTKVANVNPMAYKITPQDKKVVKIPEVCKPAYNTAIPSVAVIDFANNTTFDFAKAVQAQGSSRYKHEAAVGGVVGSGGFVVGGVAQGERQVNIEAVSREVNSKLGESVAETLMAEISNIGHLKIYTRRDLQKVLQEHKLQMSGLIDPSTAVQIGKLSGVRYIITGSVNNVNLKWVEVGESVKRDLSQRLGLLGTALAFAASTQEGWNISVDLTVKIIDAQTGEIILAKQVSGREVIGKAPTLSYDAIIGGIKKASKEALEDIRPEISKLFTLRGYIIQLRTSPDGKSRIALINVGSSQGVKPGQEFHIIEFQEVEDPLTGNKKCDMVKLPIKLVISSQVQKDKAWAIIKAENPSDINLIKLGHLVERKPLEGQGFIKKLF